MAKEWRWFKGLTRHTVLMSFLILFALFSLYLLIRFREVVVAIATPFFLALLIAYLLKPLVKLFEKRQVPRSLSIIIVYTIFIVIISVFSLHFFPKLLTDLQEMTAKIPDFMLKLQSFFTRMQSDYERFNVPPAAKEVLEECLNTLQDNLIREVEHLNDYLLRLFNSLLLLALVPILAYYIMLDEKNLQTKFLKTIPRPYRRRMQVMFAELDRYLGAYLRSMLIISVLVGIMTYLGFLFLGLDFALFLGLLNGTTNLIPFIGPFIGAVPAVGVALLDSPALALRALILIIVIQQLESQVISPQLLGRSLGFHPLFVIFALLLGGHLAGFWGLLFALPLATALRIFFKHFWRVIELSIHK